MAEGSLANRYRQYKVGTAKIVTWLAHTARSIQDVSSMLPSLKAAHNAARQAKRKHKDIPNPDTSVKVTTAQLVSLVKIITCASSSIPDEVLRTLRTVIDGRQHCAEWYTSMHDSSDSTALEQHGTHQYFIKVLKDILHMLESSKRSTAAKKSTSKPNKPTTLPRSNAEHSLSNKFELLEIEEPTFNALGSTPTARVSAKVVTFALEPSNEEETFAIWCLLQDFQELRNEIKSLWTDYKNGKISYNSVAHLTSIGIRFLQNTFCEFQQDYPELGSYPAILKHAGLLVGAMHREVFICPEDNRQPTSVSCERTDKHNIAELFCARAWPVLLGFVELLGKKIGKCNEPIEKLETFAYSHPFDIVLGTLLPYFEAVSRMQIGSRMETDEFLGVLHVLAVSPRQSIPTWVIMACQIHMDIYELIGSNVEHEIFCYHQRMASDLTRMRALRQIVDFYIRSDAKDSMLECCSEGERTVLSYSRDPYNIAGPQVPSTAHLPEKAALSLYPVYTAFPTIPGGFINHAALALQS